MLVPRYLHIRKYRESCMICSKVNAGLYLNHMHLHRGHNFVEQKIVKAAVAISKGLQETLYLGNIYAKRDLGHSEDYVRHCGSCYNRKLQMTML